MTRTMMASSMGMPTTGMSSMGAAMPAAPTGMNCVMVPRCDIKFEKCTDGMKIMCSCDDKMAAGTLQNLCMAMAGGMCSCCCMMNGMMVCCCNLTMGMCKCEMTKDGVCITCTSGDKECCKMIQACCDSLSAMCDAGCMCYVMMNNMPVCCCC